MTPTEFYEIDDIDKIEFKLLSLGWEMDKKDECRRFVKTKSGYTIEICNSGVTLTEDGHSFNIRTNSLAGAAVIAETILSNITKWTWKETDLSNSLPPGVHLHIDRECFTLYTDKKMIVRFDEEGNYSKNFQDAQKYIDSLNFKKPGFISVDVLELSRWAAKNPMIPFYRVWMIEFELIEQKMRFNDALYQFEVFSSIDDKWTTSFSAAGLDWVALIPIGEHNEL